MHHLQVCSKISGHEVNFRTTFKISGISGQSPGLQLAATAADQWL